MLSEKTYWVILIVGLIIFVSLIGFVLIPYEILDYNLGINLISEGIGILLTVVFLAWLFNLREALQWKSVKDRVLKRLGTEIYLLSRWLMSLCRVSFERSSKLVSGKVFFDYLEELNSKKSIQVWDEWKMMLFEGTLTSFLEGSERRLADIEMRYFRFLDAKLVDSLMEILYNLHVLSLDLRTMEKLPTEVKQEYSEKYFDGTSTGIHRIIKEVYKIHKMGIEICPK